MKRLKWRPVSLLWVALVPFYGCGHQVADALAKAQKVNEDLPAFLRPYPETQIATVDRSPTVKDNFSSVQADVSFDALCAKAEAELHGWRSHKSATSESFQEFLDGKLRRVIVVRPGIYNPVSEAVTAQPNRSYALCYLPLP